MTYPEQSHTSHIDHTPIDYTVEIRGTTDRGAEIVVSVVNSNEEPLKLLDVLIQYWVDGVDKGEHPVYFRELDKRGVMTLEQFVVQEGHFHVPDLRGHEELRTRVWVDVLNGDHVEHGKTSQRLKTATIARKPTIA